MMFAIFVNLKTDLKIDLKIDWRNSRINLSFDILIEIDSIDFD